MLASLRLRSLSATPSVSYVQSFNPKIKTSSPIVSNNMLVATNFLQKREFYTYEMLKRAQLRRNRGEKNRERYRKRIQKAMEDEYGYGTEQAKIATEQGYSKWLQRIEDSKTRKLKFWEEFERRVELHKDPNVPLWEKDIQGIFFDPKPMYEELKKLEDPITGPFPLPRLHAEFRTLKGKKVTKLRESGIIPAVLQGKGLEPLMLQIRKGDIDSIKDTHIPWQGIKVLLIIENELQLARIRTVNIEKVRLQPLTIYFERETEITPGDLDLEHRLEEQAQLRAQRLSPKVPTLTSLEKKYYPGLDYDQRWWRYDRKISKQKWEGQDEMDAKDAALTERLLKLDRLKVEKQARTEIADLPSDEFYKGIEDQDDRIPPEHFEDGGIIYVNEKGEIIERLIGKDEVNPDDAYIGSPFQPPTYQKVTRSKKK